MVRKVIGRSITALFVLLALGLLSWFIFAKATDATLITFRTGSMAPTMPQGAVAVTVPIRASELVVDDVITVQRANELVPVTHRVTAIGPLQERPDNAADIRAAAPGSGPPDLTNPHARQIQLQGDDNDTPDHLPYALTDARKVVFAVPYLGSVLMILQAPLGRGAMILVVASLVVWAFWPRTPIPATTASTRSTPRHAAR